MPSVIKKGLTTIFWGSGALLGGGLASAIVETLSRKPKIDAIAIEDNDGFTKTDVILDDGADYQASLLYDSAITYPATGDPILVKTPRDSTGKACYVIDDGDEVARKKEGTVKLQFRYRPGITITIP